MVDATLAERRERIATAALAGLAGNYKLATVDSYSLAAWASQLADTLIEILDADDEDECE